jgi:hypothetical protein
LFCVAGCAAGLAFSLADPEDAGTSSTANTHVNRLLLFINSLDFTATS